MGLQRQIAIKLLWIAASFTVFYFIGMSFGFIPENVKGFADWLGANFGNFTLIFVAIIALAIVRTLTKFKNKKLSGFQ